MIESKNVERYKVFYVTCYYSILENKVHLRMPKLSLKISVNNFSRELDI